MKQASKNALSLLVALGAVWLAIFLSCGCAPEEAPQAAAYIPSLAAAVGIASEATRPKPEPEPEPDSDICENCNGTGKVGDGTVFVECVVCDGTGKRVKLSETPSVPPEDPPLQDESGGALLSVDRQGDAPAPLGTIEIFTSDGDWCSPCLKLREKIKANEQGILDLLTEEDVKVFRVPQRWGTLPTIRCEGKSFVGSDVSEFVQWLESRKDEK